MQNTLKKKVLYIGIPVLLLVLLRLAAPDMVRWYVNQTIRDTEGISGTVGDVDLYLWRGAYQLNDVKIDQLDKQGATYSLLSANSISMSLLWSSIFKDRWVTKMEFERPDVVLLKHPEQSAIKSDAILDQTTWLGLADDLVLFSIDTLKVRNGIFRYLEVAEKKQAAFFITHLNGVVKDIVNQKKGSAIATADLTGQVLDKAELKLTASFDPNKKLPTFDANLEMSRLGAQYLDQLVDFYAPFDIEAGQVDLAAELVAEEGQVDGYIKAGIYDLDIFSWDKDVGEDQDNPLRLLIEMASGFLAGLLENQKHNLVATRVPIKGQIKDPDIPVIEAIAGLLHNAFIEAYKMEIENLISFSDSPEKTAESDKAG
ncbi:DUF748 domain-containing protein [Neptunicella sp. SCSIO 80796]|uniref:DUF748 domain-containing protein n=1 Tax=Neptunicella plasticusilytica TaxID=3117012 RepID=UPI003A4D6BDB